MSVATANRRRLTRYVREDRALSGRVDRAAGIIRGVKIVGTNSPNTHGVRGVTGTEYTLEALEAAVALYEGINVNVDHPPRQKPDQERSAKDRFAWLEDVHVTESGLYGDLHFLDPQDPLAVKMLNAAESKPDAYALSHNAVGKGEVREGKYVVTEIPEVRSVDIVADGGTNRSLFEGAENVATITLRQLIEKAPPTKRLRTRKLLEMYEDMGDMEVPAADDGAADEPDELDHLFQAFKKCMEDDPEKANKILKLLKAETEGGDDGEGETDTEESEGSENDDDSEANADKKESRTVKPPKSSEVRLTEARAKAMCKTAGVEATQDVIEAIQGASFDQALAVINLAKRAAAPLRGSPPRSSSRTPVVDGTAPAANDSKGWAAKLLG
jgi:hypothetical protein